jgi:hypothetical protein
MRTVYAVLVLLAVGLTVTTPAHANTTLRMPDGPAHTLYQRWVDESNVPTADITIDVSLENYDSGHAAGMEYVRPSRRHPEGVGIRLRFPDLSYLAQPDGTPNPLYGPEQLDSVHALFMHEIGHVFDWSHRHDFDNGQASSPLRRGFLRLMTLGDDWFSSETNPHEVTFDGIAPVETFADAYADCATPSDVYRNYQGYGSWIPARGQRAATCRLIRRVATHAQTARVSRSRPALNMRQGEGSIR